MSLVRRSLSLLLALAVAAPAGAVELPVTGFFGFQIPTLPAFQVNAVGVVQANPGGGGLGHLDSLGIAAGFGSRVTTIAVTDPAVAPIRGIQVSAANGEGLFSEQPDGFFGGRMPLHGVTKVCLFGPCSGAIANVLVPMSVVGSGGAVAVEAAVNVTVRGAPWTTAPLSIGSVGSRGSRAGPGGLASSTAMRGGRLNMVTPIYISTNLGAIPTIDSVGRLSMSFQGSLCEVELDDTSYADGDTVRLTRLRFASLRNRARLYHVQLYVKAPVAEITVPILDLEATLPPDFDRDLAPIAAIPVGPSQPRGTYQFGCSILDMVTGQLHVDEAAFALE